MQKPKQAVSVPPPVVERDDVQVATNRCPYCHDAVDVSASDWSSCRSCQARHHEACWDEAGACSSCGETARLVTEGRERTLGPVLSSVGLALCAFGYLSGAYATPLEMLRFSGAVGALSVLVGLYLVVRCVRQLRRQAPERELARSAAIGLALLGLGLLGSIVGGLSIWGVLQHSETAPTPEQLAEGAKQMWGTVQLASVCAAPSFLLLLFGFRRGRTS